MLCLKIDLADILSDNTEAYKLDARHEQDNDAHAGPTLYRIAQKITYYRIYDHKETDYGDRYSEPGDEPDGFYAETCYALEGKIEHLGQRIMAASGNTLFSVIEYGSALEAYEREHTAKEDINFLKVLKLLQHL